MAESYELPDETERLQINLEDDVRAFLLSRLTGNRMDPRQRVQLQEMGVDVRKLSKPSYIAVKSGCDLPEEEDAPIHGCHVGAEGYMVHEDEAVVHLAFKCGDDSHDMHYSTFLPMSIVELAKAMEAVWPGSIMGPLLGGYLYSSLSPRTPFVAAAVLFFVAIPLIYLIKEKSRESS